MDRNQQRLPVILSSLLAVIILMHLYAILFAELGSSEYLGHLFCLLLASRTVFPSNEALRGLLSLGNAVPAILRVASGFVQGLD